MDSAALEQLLSSPDLPPVVYQLIQDPAAILMAAALLEMWLPLPRAWRAARLTPLFNALGSKVNRPQRSSSERYFAGILLPLLILGVVLFLTLLLFTLAGFEVWLSFVLLILLLELNPQERLALQLKKLLTQGQKQKAKELLTSQVLRDTTPLSAMGTAKAGCECIALRLFSGWFAVIVWYLILGIEGAVLMQTVFVLNTAFNVKLAANRSFGLGIRRILQAMLLLPALVYGLLHLLNLRGFKQFKAGFAGMQNCAAAPCSGFMLSLTAYLLHLSLGGPRYYEGTLVRYSPTGGEHNPMPQDLLRVLQHVRFYGFLLIGIALAVNIALAAET